MELRLVHRLVGILQVAELDLQLERMSVDRLDSRTLNELRHEWIDVQTKESEMSYCIARLPNEV